jgi:hypothetical protein
MISPGCSVHWNAVAREDSGNRGSLVMVSAHKGPLSGEPSSTSNEGSSDGVHVENEGYNRCTSAGGKNTHLVHHPEAQSVPVMAKCAPDSAKRKERNAPLVPRPQRHPEVGRERVDVKR